MRPLDPQSPAACSPQFTNDRILSATNDFDTGEHARTSEESAVLLHRLPHDLPAQGFTKAWRKSQFLKQGRSRPWRPWIAEK
jgi:hypothetical protein